MDVLSMVVVVQGKPAGQSRSHRTIHAGPQAVEAEVLAFARVAGTTTPELDLEGGVETRGAILVGANH